MEEPSSWPSAVVGGSATAHYFGTMGRMEAGIAISEFRHLVTHKYVAALDEQLRGAQEIGPGGLRGVGRWYPLGPSGRGGSPQFSMVEWPESHGSRTKRFKRRRCGGTNFESLLQVVSFGQSIARDRKPKQSGQTTPLSGLGVDNLVSLSPASANKRT